MERRESNCCIYTDNESEQFGGWNFEIRILSRGYCWKEADFICITSIPNGASRGNRAYIMIQICQKRN